MSPEEIGARLAEALGAGEVSVSAGGRYARPCVDVPPAAWTTAATAARDQVGLAFFDWLAGVDEGERGFGVVLHLWSTTGRYGALIRTVVPRDEPVLATLTGVFPGASWPEREAAEMFGLRFEGHPNPGKLLLPDEFEGHPLRKDFILAARVAKAWPGAKEPGESDAGAPGRRRVRPPGVPEPTEWGPDATGLSPEDAARAARAARTERAATRTAGPADRASGAGSSPGGEPSGAGPADGAAGGEPSGRVERPGRGDGGSSAEGGQG